MKIGIPRALLYFWYGSEWEYFWQQCGCETLTSPPTDRAMIKAGSEVAVDELCLPIKIFLGHVLALAPRVDWVMIPHLVKVMPNTFICPKFIGLPDLVAHTVGSYQAKTFTVTVEAPRNDQRQALKAAALHLGVNPKLLATLPPSPLSETPGVKESSAWQGKLNDQELTIGLLGHPYCLYDPGFNQDLLGFLARNRVGFLTPELMPEEFNGKGSAKLEKQLFWHLGLRQLDGLEWMLHRKEGPVDGFIQVTPFACGPEALVGDLLERRIKQMGAPLLKLNFEEHSGEAGMVTRLEAFLDLIKFRSRVS